MYTVRMLDTEEFKQAREAWNGLTSAMVIPSIFCTWEWIYTWWEHFGSVYDPLILAVYDGPTLKGILPLALHKANPSKNPLKGRILSYCSSQELYPDHLDIICAREDAPLCLSAVFDYLSTEYRKWDSIELSLLSQGSNFISFTNKEDFQFDTGIQKRSVAPYIAFPYEFEEYTKTFSSNLRYNLKRRQRQLYEHHGVQYTSCATSEITEGLRVLFHLHKLRAGKKNIKSTFVGERLFNFHIALSQHLTKNDCLWLRFLKNKSDIIAAFYGFSFQKHLFYYQIGLDPEWERYSPGMVLIYAVINEAFTKGHKEFDFLRGNEEYKSNWTSESRDLFALNIYNKTLMANVTKTVSQSKDLIKRHIKRLIR